MGYFLLVDDESVELLEHSFEFLGYPMKLARDGDEALSILKSTTEPCTLLMTDHHMPRLSGVDLIIEVFSRKFSVRNIVLYSAKQFTDDELAPIRAANKEEIPFCFFHKPVSPDDLKKLASDLGLTPRKDGKKLSLSEIQIVEDRISADLMEKVSSAKKKR